MAMSNLAATYKEIGELQRARDLGEEALAGLREVLGVRHSLTQATAGDLATTLDLLGETEAAGRLASEISSGGSSPSAASDT